MPQGALQVYGTEKMARLGRELRVIGGPTARGLRSNMRKTIVASAKPIKTDVQAAYRAMPVSDAGGSTGLRNALAKAVQIKILASSRTALVRVWVNPARMPPGKGGLIAYMEGVARKPWLHPVYADGTKTRQDWAWTKTPQASHPTFYPTVRRRAAGVRLEVIAAVKATLAQLPKEM